MKRDKNNSKKEGERILIRKPEKVMFMLEK